MRQIAPHAIWAFGLLALTGGLYILNVHNLWTRDWRAVITAIGLVLTCVGAFRIIAPQFATFISTAVITSAGFFTGLGIVLIALGAFLTFKGYMT